MKDLPYFTFWCQKVLPLVYEDSLSYYEVLCKVVKYINNLIDSDKEIVENLNELKKELAIVQEWIKNFNYDHLVKLVEEMVNDYITAGVYFGLSDDGHFIAMIPEAWDKISFNTTGYDVNIDLQPEYGHLVLNY